MNVCFIISLIMCIPYMLYSKNIVEEYQNIVNDVNARKNNLWSYPFEPNIIFVDMEKNKMHILLYNEKGLKCLWKSWDNKVTLANSVVDYKGRKYITIDYNFYKGLPYVKKKKLIAHEWYHLKQDSIGYSMVTSNNVHLDNGIGRVLLRCELNALYKAVEGDMSSLKDALYIRTYRQNMYPSNNEAEFELNEGLAEYTGLLYAYGDTSEMKKAMIENIINNTSIGYTNYFAYMTGPIYAHFSKFEWHKNGEKRISDLTQDLRLAFTISPNVCSEKIKSITAKYGYEKIREEERVMDKSNELIYYLNKKTYLLLENENVNILFNPNDRVFEVNDSLVSLINIQLKAEWGQLTATKGLMRKKNWSGFILPPPGRPIKEREIRGDDYQLMLNEGYGLTKEENIWKIIKLKN